MSNWAAPAVVFSLGSTAAFVCGEPGAVFLVGIIALLGYKINKEGN